MSASEEVAALGGTQRFECQVVGYPSPIVTWFKDEVDITRDPRYNIHFDQVRGVIALTIREVLPTDEGCYQCRAQNSEGYATTTAYLVVRVDHGLSRGFRSMLVSEKISEQESSQMQMASANKQRVIEEVITRYEESEKEVIEEKLFPPKLTYDRALSDGVQLKAGSTLYIEVGVSGIPFPSVAWKHGDTLLKEDARITMEDDPSGYSYLKVKGTTREDEGTYKVMAENTVGKDEASFNIVIRGTPTAPRNLHIQEVYKDYIVIRWEAPEQDGGFPITSYNIEKSLSGGTFLSVNQVLPSEHEFKVTRLYEGSEYMFRVSAENKAGVGAFATTDKPTKARLPFDPPGKPRDLMVTSVDKDSVGLSWEAPESDGGALITSFIVERKDVMRASSMWAIAATVDGTTRSLMVGKLFTGNCYHFRVFAENRVGPGEPATLDDGVIAKLPYDSPGPARNIRAVETNVDYIVLEWDPPESDGGSPLTSYIVEKRDARRKEFIYIADIGPECTQFKATRLFEGYEYYFRVFAENIVGPSEPCEMEKPVRAKLPYDEPYPPHSLRVTDYWTDFITIEWEGPENDGGSPLTGYVIEKRDALRQSWIKAGNVGPDVNNFKVTNLFEGTDYVLRVFAENKVGPSLTAAELEKPQRAKMPYDAPMAPQSLTTSDVTSESVTVSWTAPANDGGAEITRYAIEKRDAMRMTWGVCGYTEPGVNTFTVEGLIAGDNYFFRVAAENKVGRGDYVELIHPITAKMPYDKPGPPSNLRTTDVWKNYITIAWEAPEYDGGAPILGYHIEIRDTMKAEFRDVGKTAANVTEFQVGCLEEGRDYYFRVFACNKAGVGENPSSLKPAVKAQLPYDRPSAPTALTVVGTGKGTISITWGLPDNEGGSPVTGYTIEACHAREPDNYKPVGTVEATILDYTITDLIDGGDYFVRVRAENAAGLSDEAAQTDLPVCAREPKTAPEAPGALTVTSVTSESVTVTWSAPASDGGSKVTSYTVEVREVGMTFTPAVEVDGSTLTATLPGLTPEKAYEIQVFAKNSEGLSSPVMLAEPFKTEPAPVTMTPPSAPKGLRVTEVRSDAITITWEAPESDGGSPVTHYVVVIKDAASTKKFRKAGRVDANTMTLTVTDKIKPGHEYNMVVYGENEAGVSDDGAELATPVMVPEPQPVVEPQAVVEELVEMVESAPVEAAKPKAVPGTPGNARCEAVTSEGFTLTWDAPADSGGSIITKYTIVMRDVEKKKFKSVGEVDGTTTSFLVDKVKSEHEYVLRVYAENEVGLSAESEISEPIKVPAKKSEDTVDAKGPAPEIVTAPEPVAIAEGETIRLTCKVKGNPDPDVRWFKGHSEIIATKRNPRIKTEWSISTDEYILTILNATTDDAAMYTAEVSNSHGISYKRAEVVVADVEAPSNDDEPPPNLKTAPCFVQTLTASSEQHKDLVKETQVTVAKMAGSLDESSDESSSVSSVSSSDISSLSSSSSESESESSEEDDKPFKDVKDMVTEVEKETILESVKEKTAEIVKDKATEAVMEKTPEPVKEKIPEPVKEKTPEPVKEKTPEPLKEKTPEPVKEKSPEPAKDKTPEPVKEKSPEPVKEKTPELVKEKTPEPVKEKTPEPLKEKTPEPVKEKTPEPVKDKTPEPVKEKTPEPVKEKTPEPIKEKTPEQVKEKTPEPVKEKTPEPVKEIPKTPEIEPSPESEPSSESLSDSRSEEVPSGYPRIDIRTQDIDIAIGSRITVSCHVSGDPDPDVEWYKDGKAIKIKRSNKRVRINWDMDTDIYTLEVDKAMESDAGEYMIKAINSKGTQEFKVEVDVGETLKRKRVRQEMSVSETIEVKETAVTEEAKITQKVEEEAAVTIEAAVKPIPAEPEPVVEEVMPDVVTEVQSPVPKTESPTPVTEAPVPKPESPTPKAESPAPEAEALAPKAESPVPKAESPAPKAKSPVPKAESPAPEIEKLVPKAESPAPKAESPAPEAIELKEPEVPVTKDSEDSELKEPEKPKPSTPEPEAELISQIVIDEVEPEIAEVIEAAVTEKGVTPEIAERVDTEAVLTMDMELSEVVQTTKTELVSEVITKAESEERVEVVVEAKEQTPATTETEVSMTLEAEETVISSQTTITESEMATVIQKDVTQITSVEESLSEKEEELKVVGVLKDVTQIAGGLQIVSISGSEPSSDESSSEEEEGAAPKFITKPEATVVDFGEEIRLTCQVSGDPEPEVTWYKGDKRLKASKREPRLKIHWDMAQDLNVLVIMDAGAEDSGQYTVVAENEHGTFRFTVTVLVGKPAGAEIIKTIESKRTVTTVEETVVDGEVVERTVKSETSEDTPEVTVERSEVSESTLPVAVAQEEGAAPKFEQPPEPMLVDFGEEIRLTCRVTGDPEPEVTWYKEGEEIKSKKGEQRVKVDWDMKQDLNILTIKDATKEDAGKYTVIADNKFGSFKFSVTVLVGKPEGGGEIIKTTESKRAVTVVEETIVDGEVVERTVKEDVSETEPMTVVERITVAEAVTPAESEPEGRPPKFVQPPEPVFVDFGETVKLTCKVEGAPKPEVSWYKAKSKIESQDRTEVKYSKDDDIHILVIIDANSDDAGEYTVIAENKYGSFKFTVTVLVGYLEGAEIVKKDIQTKRTVKFVEEMVVDGQVVQRVIQDDVSEYPSSSIEQPDIDTQSKDDVETQFVITLDEDTEPDQVIEVITDSTVQCDTSTTQAFTLDFAEESSMDVALHERIETDEKVAVTDRQKTETQQVEISEIFSMTDDVVAVSEKTAVEDKVAVTETIIPGTQQAEASETFIVPCDDIAVSEETVTEEKVAVTETKSVDRQHVDDSETFTLKDDSGEAPKFSQPPQPVFVDFGETIALTCKVTGSPMPSITWYKAGEPIIPKADDIRVKVDFDVKQDLHILTIIDATAEDAADYAVIADNAYGSFKFTVTVLVGRPEGAEIVKKTIESKRSVKVIEETVVDGEVVERIVKEDVTEDEPREEIIKEKTAIISQSAPITDDIQIATVSETLVMSTETVSTAEISDEKVQVEETISSKVAPEMLTKGDKKVKKADVKKIATTSSEDSSSDVSSDEESSSEVSSSDDEEGKKTEKMQEKDKLEKKDTKEGQPPKFTQPPEPIFVDVGETIRLTCQVTGDPEPTVTWCRMDDELLSTSDLRIQVEQIGDTYTLTIKDATEEDAGDYKVKAANKYGTFNFTVTVLVGHPAGAHIVETTRTTKSVHETVVDGEVVEHEEKEDVQVEKFDQVDSHATVKVESSEMATLKQEVIEEAVTKEVIEEVEVPRPADDKSPKFDVLPKPVSVEEGETIRLTCKVSGAPEPEVCWYKGDAQIKPSKRDTRIQTTWSMADDLNHLVVTTARLSDAGEYTVRAHNSHGQQSVTVSVMVGTLLVVEKQETVEDTSEMLIQEERSTSEERTVTVDVTIEEEESTSSQGVATEGVTETTEEEQAETEVSVPVIEDAEEDVSVDIAVEPTVAEVSQTFTETDALQTESTSTEVSTTMELAEGKEHDAAAVVTETVTEVFTHLATQKAAEVPGAPKIDLEPKPVIVDVGEMIEISCRFSGDPEPEVMFFKGEMRIKNKKTNKRVHVDWDMKTDLYTLTIQEATPADAGDYIICAENSHGEIRYTVSVVVGHEVVETTSSVTSTEQTVVSGGVEHTIVHEETLTQSSSAAVTKSVSTVKETSVMDICDSSTEEAVEVSKSAVSETLEISDDAAKDVVEGIIETVETSITETIVVSNDIVADEPKEDVNECKSVAAATTETVLVESVDTIEDTEMERVSDKASSVDSSEDSSSESESESEGESVSDGGDVGAPTIEQAPEPVNVKLGETIYLKCKVTGDPEPDVIWLRDDIEIKPRRLDKRVKIDWDMNQNLYVLTIKDATLNDAGEYAVKASNVNGGFTLKVTVVVRDGSESIADTVTTKTSTSQVETIDETGNATMVVQTETTSISTVTNGTEIATNQSASESISESVLESPLSEEISVGVAGAPVMELAPEPAVVKVGGTIHLTCSVKGDPEPSVTWWKGQMPIPINDLRIHQSYDLVTRVSSLAIEKASIIDTGKYAVHAENSKGLIIVSVDVVISDEITELIIQDRILDKVVHDSSDLTLVEAASQQRAETSELSVEEIIARELSGVHGTETQMMMTESSHTSAALGSLPPGLEVAPEPQSVKEGDTLRLTCKVSGQPEPTVSWLRGGQALDGDLWDRRMNIDFVSSSGMHVFAIHDCRRTDAGDYTVLVQNTYGSASHTVSVHVSSCEETLVESISVEEASDLALTCGKAKIKTTRFDLSSDDLHFDMTSDLSTAGLIQELTGTKSVQSFHQQSTGRLGGPVLMTTPEPMTVAFGETIRLTCRATGDPEPDVTWHKDGKQIKTRLRDKRIRVDWDMKTDEQFLEIHDATKADAGDYELRAENDKGSTSFTVSVNVGDTDSAAVYERHVVTSSSSSSSSMTSSSLLDDPMFSDMGGSMRFSSHFK